MSIKIKKILVAKDLSRESSNVVRYALELAQSGYRLKRELEEMQGSGDAPSEERLEESRGVRDRLWSLLRRRWLDDENSDSELSEIGDGSSLADQFEQRIEEADEISDRLRREADRVQQLAALAADLREIELRSSQVEEQLQDSTDERLQTDIEWQSLWAPCAIQPLPPREMREWFSRVEKLRDLVNNIDIKNKYNKEMGGKLNIHYGGIEAQLRQLEKMPEKRVSYARLLNIAVGVVAAIDLLQERQQGLFEDETSFKQKLRMLDSGKHQAETEFDAWKLQWRDAVAGLGLTHIASPSEVNTLIEKCGELFGKLKEAHILQQRIDGIDKDAELFRQQVGRVIEQVSEDFSELSEEDAVVRLNALLTDNRAWHTKFKALEKQSRKLHLEKQESAETIKSMRDRLQTLCAEAQCGDLAELETAERDSDEHLRLKRELADLERQILEAGEGASLQQLEAEAQHAHADSLPAEIAALERSIEEELLPQQRELAEEKGRLHKELELMDGSDAVALLAEESQSALADIRSHAEHYVRVKLAARILRDQIEEYRKHNQGPLIKRASEHFAALTGNSFASLQTDFNSKDEPVLVGIRPDDARVHVEGMSAGTRDQLYLALRLASLEKYIHNAGPMPFIVDDILVDFDDQRSKAALERLSQLSLQTQVILFTHHMQLVEQAESLGKAHVQIHKL